MRVLKKIISIGILFLLLFPVYSQSADRYVTESGTDTSNDCKNSASPCATIDHAVDQAGNGDTVKIAQGTYPEGVTLYTSINPLTIQGGWNEDFSNQSENPALTIIDGGETERAFYIHIVSADVTLEGLTIKDGYNGSSGGGIYAIAQNQTVSLTLNNLILESNSGGNNGGAVCVTSSGTGGMTLAVDNCIIRNNDAIHGAGIAVSSSSDGTATATIKNSFISDNSSINNGGGLYVSAVGGDADVKLICNTITNNTGPSGLEYGGAVWVESGSGSGETVYNSIVYSTDNIIWGNSYNDIFIQPDDDVSTAQVNSAYSDIGTVGVSAPYGDISDYHDNGHNINSDPLFINASAGNYHLKGSSPCIGAGVFRKSVDTGGGIIYSYSSVPSEDFDGDSRSSDWVQVSSSTQYKYCDMGADEYIPSTSTSILYLLLQN